MMAMRKLTMKQMNEVKAQVKKQVERNCWNFTEVKIMVYKNNFEDGEISVEVVIGEDNVELISWEVGFTKEEAIKEAIRFSEHIETMMTDFILDGNVSFDDVVHFDIWC